MRNPVDVVLPPADGPEVGGRPHIVGIGERIGGWQLQYAVVVDVGIGYLRALHLGGPPDGAVALAGVRLQGHILQPPVFPGENVGDLPVFSVGGGDKQRRRHVLEIARLHADQLLHPVGQWCGGVQLQDTIPEVIDLHSAARRAVDKALCLAHFPCRHLEHEDFLLSIPVNVINLEAGVVGAHQLKHLITVDGVSRQGVPLPRCLPVHDELLGGAVVKVLIVDGVNRIS